MIEDKMLSRIQDSVGYIIFNNPEKHNAVSIEMWDSLEKFVKETLENHYDPKYNFSATKHMNKIKHEIDIIKLDKLSIDNASKKILEYFN